MAQERSFASTGQNAETTVIQIARYLADAAEAGGTGAMNSMLDFWSSRRAIYSCMCILPLAEDLLSAPASQAYVERVFSLCELLITAGRRNRMSKALEMRAFLEWTYMLSVAV